MKIIRKADGSETRTATNGVGNAEIDFLVLDVTDKNSAFAEVLKAAPASYMGQYLKEVRFNGYDQHGNAEFTANYGGRASTANTMDEKSDPVLSFACRAAIKHLTHAYSQRRVVGNRDAGTMIGWNGKVGEHMEITGVDVSTGEIAETYTKVFRMHQLTTAKRRLWQKAVGKVNNAKFLGWEAGELMFMGCSFQGSLSGAEKVTVQFEFAVRLNESNAKIAGVSIGAKKGFEYVWAIPTSNVSGASVAITVDSVYVAQVCQYMDFKNLGL